MTVIDEIPQVDRLDKMKFLAYRKACAPIYARPETPWKSYCQYIYRDDKNIRIVCPEHQIEIFNFIDESFNKYKCDRIAIEAPWGHAKTQSVSVFYSSRMIGLNPNIRIKLCSANDAIATLRVGANKNLIELNQDYQRVFPKIKQGNKWGESAFRVHGTALTGTDYTMQGGGVNSSVIGGRADQLIFDDPCDMNNSMTEDTRRHTKEKILYTWMSRLAPNGHIIWIGTPWHREDAMQLITKTWRKLKICVSEDVTHLEMFVDGQFIKDLPLWDIWNEERLKKEQRDNERVFNIGFRLIPATDEDATFKHLDDAIKYNTDPYDYEYLGVWGGVDLSTKTRQGTVAELVGITPDMKRVLIEVTYLDDPLKLMALFGKWANDWGSKFNFANVENNALQDVIVDMFKGRADIPIRGFLTGKNKWDLYNGLPVLDTDFANGRLIIPVDHDDIYQDNCPTCRLIRALRLHPFGSETDSIMALWFAYTASKSYKRVLFA